MRIIIILRQIVDNFALYFRNISSASLVTSCSDIDSNKPQLDERPSFSLGKTFSLVHWIYISILVSLTYLPTPPLGQDMTQGQFLSGV